MGGHTLQNCLAMRPKYAAPVDVVVTTRYRLTMAVTLVCITVFVPNHSYARDDGRFANSPLKEWFDRLASKNGSHLQVDCSREPSTLWPLGRRVVARQAAD